MGNYNKGENMFNELHVAKDYFKTFSEKRLKDELELYSCLNFKTLKENVYEQIIKQELNERIKNGKH